MLRESARNPRGFTLLETLIAMMIIIGAILIVTNSWSGNFMRMRKTALMQEVSHLIEKKMVELDIKYRDKFADIPAEEAGDFGSDFKNYRWEMKSHDFEMPDLSSIIASANKDGNGGGIDEMTDMIVKQMGEYFRTSVKEMTLTVYAKLGKKETPFAVTTYYVDFDKEMTGLPGMGTQAPAQPQTTQQPAQTPAQPGGL